MGWLGYAIGSNTQAMGTATPEPFSFSTFLDQPASGDTGLGPQEPGTPGGPSSTTRSVIDDVLKAALYAYTVQATSKTPAPTAAATSTPKALPPASTMPGKSIVIVLVVAAAIAIIAAIWLASTRRAV